MNVNKNYYLYFLKGLFVIELCIAALLVLAWLVKYAGVLS